MELNLAECANKALSQGARLALIEAMPPEVIEIICIPLLAAGDLAIMRSSRYLYEMTEAIIHRHAIYRVKICSPFCVGRDLPIAEPSVQNIELYMQTPFRSPCYYCNVSMRQRGVWRLCPKLEFISDKQIRRTFTIVFWIGLGHRLLDSQTFFRTCYQLARFRNFQEIIIVFDDKPHPQWSSLVHKYKGIVDPEVDFNLRCSDIILKNRIGRGINLGSPCSPKIVYSPLASQSAHPKALIEFEKYGECFPNAEIEQTRVMEQMMPQLIK